MRSLPNTIPELETAIRHHNRLYWDLQEPEISDEAYDQLVVALRALAPDSPVLQEMGPSKSFGAPFRHQEPMLSLDKCYSEEDLIAWTKGFDDDVVAVAKFDGVACALHYNEQGILAAAATRGDGVTGDTITPNVLAIADIPRQIPVGPREVRGEVYMRLSRFAKYKEDGMANPRNLAAGAIKQKDPQKTATYGLSFAAYSLLGGAETTLAEELDCLARWGFPRVDYRVYPKSEAAEGYAYFAALRPSLDFEIDGVVLKVNSRATQRRLGLTGHHPRYAIAYKFQGDSGTTLVQQIEWSVARTGAITPVAIVEPLALSGVTVSRASLHNLGYLSKLGVSPGATVRIVRRGGVIPHVEEVLTPSTNVLEVPARCPSCGQPTARDRDFLFCSSPGTCRAAVIGGLAHYTTVTEMMGFGDALLEAAYNKGLLRSPADLYRLTRADIVTLDRAGEKLATKLLAEIDKARRLPLATFLRALGIPDLGKHISQLLADRCHTLDAVLAITEAELAALHGVGEITAANVVGGLAALRPTIDALRNHIEIIVAAAADGPLVGKTFVFTGKMVAFSRSEGEKRVRAKGGAVASSVTKSVNYLVIGDDKSGGPSTKEKAADKLGAAGVAITRLSEAELLALLGA